LSRCFTLIVCPWTHKLCRWENIKNLLEICASKLNPNSTNDLQHEDREYSRVRKWPCYERFPVIKIKTHVMYVYYSCICTWGEKKGGGGGLTIFGLKKPTPFKHSLSMETIDIQCFSYYSVIGDPFIYPVHTCFKPLGTARGEISPLPTLLRGRFCASPLNAQNCTL
jgi:hypothetical protein